MEYSFTNNHAFRPLLEPLCLLVMCIPFFVFKNHIPDNLWGKAIFLIAAIPFLVIWLLNRVLKIKKSPENLTLNFEANKLTIDKIDHRMSELLSLFIWQKGGKLGIDLEMANGLKIRTFVVYELNSSFDELKNRVVDFNNIDAYSYDK